MKNSEFQDKKQDSASPSSNWDSVMKSSKSDKKSALPGFSAAKAVKRPAFNKRRFKYGSLATIITVGFLVALVLVNVIVALLLERYPLTIDLTSDKRFALTQDSIDYIKGLTDDVKITVLAKEADFKSAGSGTSTVNDLYKQAYEVLKKYTQYNDKITLKFVDPVTNPTLSQEYPGEELTSGDLIIESAKRLKVIAVNTLFTSNQSQYDGSVTYRSEAEQELTSAIMYVTDKNPIKVSLISGLNAPDITAYTDLLKANNYDVVSQDLLTEEIDAESAFIVLPQPSADLTAEQVKKLETYLDNDGQFGKGLVFIASTTSTTGPLLNAFLAEWGVAVGDGMVGESNTAYLMSNNLLDMKNDIADEDIKKAMGSAANAYLRVANARPLELLFDASGNRQTKIITKTSEGAFEIPANADSSFDYQTAEKSSYPTCVLTSRTKYEGTTPKISYVLTIASPTMLDSTLMTSQLYANASLMNALDETLAAKKNSVSILPMDITVSSIAITSAQLNTYFVLLVVLIPLATLIVGVAVWLCRRHL